jgi:hypothetical protein
MCLPTAEVRPVVDAPDHGEAVVGVPCSAKKTLMSSSNSSWGLRRGADPFGERAPTGGVMA